MEDVFAILPIGFWKISTLSTSNVSDECKSRRRLHNHGGLSPASQNPYPILTKIYDIPYSIYDLIKNSKHYLWPDPYIKILFQTCVIISYLVQTSVKLP